MSDRTGPFAEGVSHELADIIALVVLDGLEDRSARDVGGRPPADASRSDASDHRSSDAMLLGLDSVLLDAERLSVRLDHDGLLFPCPVGRVLRPSVDRDLTLQKSAAGVNRKVRTVTV